MRVVMSPTFRCNLKCEYCYIHEDGTKDIVAAHEETIEHTPDDWLEGLLWMEEQYERIQTIDITGGEPYLYHGLIEFVNKIPGRIFLGLTTNTSKLGERGISGIKDERKKNMHVCISLHLGKHKEIPEHYFAAVREIGNAGFRSSVVNFVAYHKQSFYIEMARMFAKKMNMPIHIEPHIDYKDPVMHFGKFMDIFDEFSETDKNAIASALKRPVPFECGIGHSYVWITPDGDIYPCMGLLFAGEKRLGNIFEKVIEREMPVPYTCNSFCTCAQNWRD